MPATTSTTTTPKNTANTKNSSARNTAAQPRAAGYHVVAQHVTTLVDLVRQSAATLFRDVAGRAQIAFTVNETVDETGETDQKTYPKTHRETHPLRSPAARHWIAQLYQAHAGTQPAASHLQAALNLLEGVALHECEQLDVHLRLAEYAGRVYLDLADEHWRAIEIDATGWRVIADPPVRFRRSPIMLPLPLPLGATAGVEEVSGTFSSSTDGRPSRAEEKVPDTFSPASPPAPPDPCPLIPAPSSWPLLLRSFINVHDEHWPLVLGWLVAALRPRGPYPILCLHGEQGSAKSTAALLLRSLVDPSAAPHRGEPRQIRDLATAASAGHVVCLDNLSRLPDWLSNALCRLSTGAGQTTRGDSERDTELVLAASRPAMLVGIDPLTARGDLNDRALLVPLPPIDPSSRQTEAVILERFQHARPRILAGLCDAVSAALAGVSTTTLARLPRMADFALWVSAAEHALGLAPGEFLAAYEANRAAVHVQSLEASPLTFAIEMLMFELDTWTGTATDLRLYLENRAPDRILRDRTWPRSPRALSSALRRLAPALRTLRVEVEFDRAAGDARVREITIRRGERAHSDTETCDAR